MDTGTTFDQPEWVRQRLIWRISLTPIHALGILASIYRISRRYKTRQWGLDDYAATLAFILDLFFFPTLWLRNGDAGGGGGLSEDGLGAKVQTRIAQVVIGWLVQIVYPLLTWSAKISLALTIARLIPRCHPTHSASIIVAYLSTFIGIGIVIQTCVYCSRIDKTWTYVSPFRCRVTAAAGIVRLGSEVVIDVCLTLIPFCAFFWPIPFSFAPPGPNPGPTPPVRLRLPPPTRRLIKVCFTASLLTASTAIITMNLLFITQRSESLEIKSRTGYLAFVLTHLTGSVSLLVCNLLIVITSLYRFLRTQLETPRVVEVGKSPVVPDLSHQVNSGSEPISGSNNAASGAEGVAAASGNTSGNSSSLTSGGGEGASGTDGQLTTRSRTFESSASYRVDFTELFESDFSMTEPPRSAAPAFVE